MEQQHEYPKSPFLCVKVVVKELQSLTKKKKWELLSSRQCQEATCSMFHSTSITLVNPESHTMLHHDPDKEKLLAGKAVQPKLLEYSKCLLRG
jgi:hypothetical protein